VDFKSSQKNRKASTSMTIAITTLALELKPQGKRWF